MDEKPLPPDKQVETQSVRLVPLAFVLLGGYFAVSAYRLGTWSFDGPGAGLFPLMAAGMAIVCAVLVRFSPDEPSSFHDADNEDVGPMDADERRNFLCYALALVVLAVGAYLLGFILTTFAVTILIVKFGENRSWRSALIYAAVLTICGELVFGRLLSVELPQGVIEPALLRLWGA